MAKSRTLGTSGSGSQESSPKPSASTDSTPDEPIDLSTLQGGVLHNPPQADLQETPSTPNNE